MNPSRMDRRVVLLKYAPTRDAIGGVIEAWTESDTVFAEKQDQTGREFLAAGQINAAMTTRFWLRWRPDVTPADRLRLLGGRGAIDQEYDIQAVREVGRRDGLEITAVGRV